MKLRYTFKFFDTEDAARDFCDRENLAHPRRKNRAHYTPWSSNDQQEHKYIAWYYIAEGAPAMKPNATTYEIRQIDAWAEYDDPDDPDEAPAWIWNTSYYMGEFTTTGDVSRAFRAALKRLGVTFYRGRTTTEYDGDVYEIIDRETGEPLFAAIPQA